MKIVLGVHHYPPHYNGGAELRAHRTAAALRERGVAVQVICVERVDSGPAASVHWRDEVYDGVPVRRLYFDLAAAPDRFRWEYQNPWIGEHLYAYLDQERPDVFHLVGGYLMTTSALEAAQQVGIPTVVTLTDYWYLCPRIQMLRSNGNLSTLPLDPFTCARCLGEEQRRYRYVGKVAPWLMDAFWRTRKRKAQQIEERFSTLSAVLNRVDALISPSRFLRSMYLQAGISVERFIYSRQGRDFPPLEPEMTIKSPSDRLRVGYIGQISHHKGVHILLQAVRELDVPIALTVFGDLATFPDYAAKLIKIAHNDQRILFAGSFPRQEITAVMRNLDVIVVPSLWYENSPNVILEAFAQRTPVVASDLGGMAEMVKHGKNGMLFSPGDVQGLARLLHQLATSDNLLSELSLQIEPVRTVTQEIDELMGIYNLVVGSHGPANFQKIPLTEHPQFTG